MERKDILGGIAEENSKLKLHIKKISDDAHIPTRGTIDSAGLDLYAIDDYKIESHYSTLIHTGICIAIPEGYVGLLFVRSGLSRQLLRPTNCVGVIHSDYRSEVVLNLFNDSFHDKTIHKGDRVGQIVILPYISPDIVECDNLSDTSRGRGDSVAQVDKSLRNY